MDYESQIKSNLKNKKTDSKTELPETISWTHHCWPSIGKAGSTLNIPHIHPKPVPTPIIKRSTETALKLLIKRLDLILVMFRDADAADQLTVTASLLKPWLKWPRRSAAINSFA